MRLLGSLCLQRREAAILMRFVKQYCAALVWVCSRRRNMRFLLCRRFRTPRATFGQQRMGYYPRRYNTNYIPQNIIRRKSMHTFKNPEDRWGTPEDLKALGIPSEHTVISPDSGANPSSRPSPRRRLRPLEPRRPSRNPKTTSVRSRTSPKRSHRKHSRHPARRLRPGRLVPAPLGLLAGIRLAGPFRAISL